jgi:hypothetical protein
MKAIVLLGYRKAGKDSIFKELAKKYRVYNAKFASMGKTTVANICGVPLLCLEDRNWREEEFINNTSPRQLLDALFYLGEHDEAYSEAVHNYCLDNIPSDYIPVFTDVRRKLELEAIYKKYNPCEVGVHFVTREGLEPAKADAELASLVQSLKEKKELSLVRRKLELEAICKKYNACEVGVHFVTREGLEPAKADAELESLVQSLKEKKELSLELTGTLEANVTLLEQHYPYTLSNYKKLPTLFLVTSQAYMSKVTGLQNYEPLASLANDARKFLEKSKSKLGLGKLVGALYDETASEDISVDTLSQDSYMLYEAKIHERILPKLREVANLKVVASDSYDKTMFTEKEINGQHLLDLRQLFS